MMEKWSRRPTRALWSRCWWCHRPWEPPTQESASTISDHKLQKLCGPFDHRLFFLIFFTIPELKAQGQSPGGFHYKHHIGNWFRLGTENSRVLGLKTRIEYQKWWSADCVGWPHEKSGRRGTWIFGSKSFHFTWDWSRVQHLHLWTCLVTSQKIINIWPRIKTPRTQTSGPSA